MKISKNKKNHFFLMSQGSFNPKIRFLGQKVSTVGTLSGFQEVFLQPIIKDRPNKIHLCVFHGFSHMWADSHTKSIVLPHTNTSDRHNKIHVLYAA